MAQQARKRSWSVKKGGKDVIKEEASGGGHALSRDLDCKHTFGSVGQKALQGGSEKAGPNEPFCDLLIGGVKAMQIGIGFPFLEEQFDLPP